MKLFRMSRHNFLDKCPDWDSARLADPLLLGSPKSTSAPAFLSVSPPAPPVLPWFLAALDAQLSLASLFVPSSWENWYSSSRSISLSVVIAPSSALITGSLTRSVIGDRPSPSKTTVGIGGLSSFHRL